MTANTINNPMVVKANPSYIKDMAGMAYSLTSYAIGAGALFWLFFASAGIAPYSLSAQVESWQAAVGINLLLVAVFAIQHTIMARKTFKQWVTQYIPSYLERSTFVLASGVAMAALVFFWQPIGGEVWAVESEFARILVMVGSLLGMGYVLATSFITGHFELFGVRQAVLNLMRVEYTPLEFKRKWFYTYSRHPMMLGLLFVFWCTPDMTATRFFLAVALTAYLFMGIRFEEKSLVDEFGDDYRDFQKEVGLFFTFKGNDKK